MSWDTLEAVFSGRTPAADDAAALRARFSAEEWAWLSGRPDVLEAYRLAFATS